MKKLGLVVVAFILSASLVACGDDSSDVKTVGIIQYAQHPALDQANEGFVKALEDQGFKDGDTVKIDYQNAQGDSSTAETIADKLTNDGNDLIYAIATPAAIVSAQKTQDIPIVVAAVTNPEDSGLVETNKKPGGNVTGVSDLTPVVKQIELLEELVPEVKTVAVMYTNAEKNSEYQYQLAKKELEKRGIKVEKATVSESTQVQQVTESLVGKVDAIYIPTDNLVSENITSVVGVANENNIPTIVGEIAMVNKGALATNGINYYDSGYMAGLQAAKILKGDAKPADMPIEYLPEDKLELGINESTAKKLGIEIPATLLENAKIVK